MCWDLVVVYEFLSVEAQKVEFIVGKNWESCTLTDGREVLMVWKGVRSMIYVCRCSGNPFILQSHFRDFTRWSLLWMDSPWRRDLSNLRSGRIIFSCKGLVCVACRVRRAPPHAEPGEEWTHRGRQGGDVRRMALASAGPRVHLARALHQEQVRGCAHHQQVRRHRCPLPARVRILLHLNYSPEKHFRSVCRKFPSLEELWYTERDGTMFMDIISRDSRRVNRRLQAMSRWLSTSSSAGEVPICAWKSEKTLPSSYTGKIFVLQFPDKSFCLHIEDKTVNKTVGST